MKKSLKNILLNEFKFSIQLEYTLLPWICKHVAKDDSPILRWLDEIYDEVVRKMTLDIREIMRDFNIVNEAELFCSDFEFRVVDNRITKRMIGDGSRNNEDVRKFCTDRI